MLEDTIAAVATPVGEGGLAVIRVSGCDAVSIAGKVFRARSKNAEALSSVPSHTLHLGEARRNGIVLDEVIVAVMRAPRTFTREDVVEISCHGGLLPAKMILDALLEAGARLAEPGEFTRRAFLNGRIDLTQAEAVADIIAARTELAVNAANEQLAGKLSARINDLRDQMMRTLAHIEAHIDFPDEDIAPDTKGELLARLQQGISFMDELLRTADEGQILRRGVRAAIIGRPNAGKSSLLNQMLGHERAIVSPVPGTTRDTIEETANVRGIPIVFIDTAGLREASDEIELEGIRRSRVSLDRAELVLHVLDNSEPFTAADQRYLDEGINKKRLLVLNKADLTTRLELPATIEAGMVKVSCITGAGIELLKDRIKELVWAGELRADNLPVMINARHQDALRRARVATLKAMEAMQESDALELSAMELRIGVNAIGEVVGKTSTEDLLDAIFSQFCIGK